MGFNNVFVEIINRIMFQDNEKTIFGQYSVQFPEHEVSILDVMQNVGYDNKMEEVVLVRKFLVFGNGCKFAERTSLSVVVGELAPFLDVASPALTRFE